LLGRVPCGCDINPLSVLLTAPRLNPPEVGKVADRLRKIDWAHADELPEDLLAFITRRHSGSSAGCGSTCCGANQQVNWMRSTNGFGWSL